VVFGLLFAAGGVGVGGAAVPPCSCSARRWLVFSRSRGFGFVREAALFWIARSLLGVFGGVVVMWRCWICRRRCVVDLLRVGVACLEADYELRLICLGVQSTVDPSTLALGAAFGF
jgi:hypothetical protein